MKDWFDWFESHSLSCTFCLWLSAFVWLHSCWSHTGPEAFTTILWHTDWRCRGLNHWPSWWEPPALSPSRQYGSSGITNSSSVFLTWRIFFLIIVCGEMFDKHFVSSWLAALRCLPLSSRPVFVVDAGAGFSRLAIWWNAKKWIHGLFNDVFQFEE